MEKSELVNKELQKFIQGTRVIEGYDAVDELEFTLPPIWRYARSSKNRTAAQINTLKIKVSNEGLID